jgi:negative regulator of flagellin synthesis FlgM
VDTKNIGYPGTATEPVSAPKGRNAHAPVAPAQDAHTSGGSTTADHVTLTDSAVTLQKLSAAVASAPVVNASKVASVKQAVDSGTYQIDTTRVANKILGFDSTLPPGK